MADCEGVDVVKHNDPIPSLGRSLAEFEAFGRPRGTQRAQALRALQQKQSIVYAVRLADGIVKIGCTSDLARRRREFGRDAEILAMRLGDKALERKIHEYLKPHRAKGIEYYHPTPAVLSVVNGLRYHGLIQLPEHPTSGPGALAQSG
jgi:hypothetical protein